LLKLVEGNDMAVVASILAETKTILKPLNSLDTDLSYETYCCQSTVIVESAVKKLAELKGIGPATSSGKLNRIKSIVRDRNVNVKARAILFRRSVRMPDFIKVCQDQI